MSLPAPSQRAMLQAAACARAATCHAPHFAVHADCGAASPCRSTTLVSWPAPMTLTLWRSRGPGASIGKYKNVCTLSFRPSLIGVGASRLQHQVPACCRVLDGPSGPPEGLQRLLTAPVNSGSSSNSPSAACLLPAYSWSRLVSIASRCYMHHPSSAETCTGALP